MVEPESFLGTFDYDNDGSVKKEEFFNFWAEIVTKSKEGEERVLAQIQKLLDAIPAVYAEPESATETTTETVPLDSVRVRQDKIMASVKAQLKTKQMQLNKEVERGEQTIK